MVIGHKKLLAFRTCVLLAQDGQQHVASSHWHHSYIHVGAGAIILTAEALLLQIIDGVMERDQDGAVLAFADMMRKQVVHVWLVVLLLQCFVRVSRLVC
jgi:hypothetical protein